MLTHLHVSRVALSRRCVRQYIFSNHSTRCRLSKNVSRKRASSCVSAITFPMMIYTSIMCCFPIIERIENNESYTLLKENVRKDNYNVKLWLKGKFVVSLEITNVFTFYKVGFTSQSVLYVTKVAALWLCVDDCYLFLFTRIVHSHGLSFAWSWTSVIGHVACAWLPSGLWIHYGWL